MPRYISILRGINVSGRNKIRMEELRQLLENLSFQNIQTYIQSGNIVFDSSEKDTKILQDQITSAIKDKYKFDVPALVLNNSELNDIFRNNPYINERGLPEEKLHATILSAKPSKACAIGIVSKKSLPDEFIIAGRTVYLYCPNGYGRTKLTNNFFENKLKTFATTRNWKTISKLVEIANE